MASYVDANSTRKLETTDGRTYAYLKYAPRRANAPTLLLLHGYPSSAYDWRHLIPHLVEAGVGVVAPDLLGYGGTDKPSDPASYTMKRISRQVADILDAEKLDTVIGVAHDWGCGLLSRMALHHRDRFSALSFISVSYLPPSPFDVDEINKMTKEALGYEIFGYWDVLQRDEAASLIESNHDMYEALTYSSENDVKNNMAKAGALYSYLRGSNKCQISGFISPEELQIHRKILLQGGYAGPTCWYKQSVRGLGAVDDAAFSEEESKLTVPTQFVATSQDSICVPSIMLKICEPWVNDLRVIQIDTGHWAMLENPEKLAEEIIVFANSLSVL